MTSSSISIQYENTIFEYILYFDNQINGALTIRVGITGGMGSGKTTVCALFSTLDIPIYNADERAKAIMGSDEKLKMDIIDLLGENAYINGRLNTKFIAEKIFSDHKKLNEINQLVHPKVFEDLDSWFLNCKSPYAIYESALISNHEADQDRELDYIIYVYASKDLRLKRILDRGSIERKEILSRMSKQPDPIRVIERADYLIINEGRALIPQILKLHRCFLAMT